jgi:ParB family chromosome partitioning protein
MHAIAQPPAGITDDSEPALAAGTAAHVPAGTRAEIQQPLMVAVSDLAAHPGNVREDLSLTEEFAASVASEGVRIPLLITTGRDGGWLVIEGHRRLAAAARAGLAEVPCHVDPGRADDEAGQYLDMLLANGGGYRANYTVLEEAAALFAAHQAGASRTRIRKATGRSATQVKTALAAGGLSEETRARAAGLDSAPTLGDLALLAEFGDDQEATERLLACLEHGYPLEHAAERIRRDRAEAAEHARLRAELEAAGVPVTDGPPPGAAWLTSLRHDGQDLTPEAHAACPGHGTAFAGWNPQSPSYYCASPAEHRHVSRLALPGSSGSAGDGSQPAEPAGPPDPGRRLVIAGNRAWQAAAVIRHRWIAASLFTRRSVPREVHVFTARQLLTIPDPLRQGLATAQHKDMFATLTGRGAGTWDQDCDTATAGRLALAVLAPVVTAYEHAMTEGEGRNTWRTDRYSPCPRNAAGGYLAFLASIGYQMSDIEQAVAFGTAFTGETPLTDALADADPADDGGDSPAGEASGGDAATSDRGDSGHDGDDAEAED